MSAHDDAKKLVSQMSMDEKLSQVTFEAAAIPRLGIPGYNWWSEALHGVARAGVATVFPQAIGMAATFDPGLIQAVAAATAIEGRGKYNAAYRRRGETGRYQGLTFWTPNINIFRDPRWGRGQETYGEDPVLTGLLGTAFVRGLQWGIGEPIGAATGNRTPDTLIAAACAKHFAVHSGPEAKRHHFNAVVSRKDLFETYLPAFEALVDAGVEAVMGAYNRVNGEACCGSAFLLGEVLRERWGFEGHVVSDCWAIRDFHEGHGVTETPLQSVALAVNNGCDLNCGDSYALLSQAVTTGLVDEGRIDEMVTRLMATRIRLGIVPSTGEPTIAEDAGDSAVATDHASLAQTVAERSMVLLMNRDVTLPLDPAEIDSVYVTGPFANDGDVLLGNYYGTPTESSTFLDGLGRRGGMDVKVEYRPGCLPDRPNGNNVQWAVGEAAAADVTIVVLGNHPLMEGEEGDAIASGTRGDRTTIEIPSSQVDYLKQLRERARRLVLVLTGGGAFALDAIQAYCDAIIVAWYPGQAGGTALSRIIFGDVSPSGKLPVTFPRSTRDLPPFTDYGMSRRTYRYSDSFCYPFGFGLTYGSVSLLSAGISFREDGQYGEDGQPRNRDPLGSPIEMNLPDRYFSYRGGAARNRSIPSPFRDNDPRFTVRVEIRNDSQRGLHETIQVYLRHPELRDTPRWQLAGIAGVTIDALETTTVLVEVPLLHVTVVNADGVRYLPHGPIDIFIGTSSPGGEAIGAAQPIEGRLEVVSSCI